MLIAYPERNIFGMLTGTPASRPSESGIAPQDCRGGRRRSGQSKVIPAIRQKAGS
jgi:hypothetical protein